MLSRMASSAGKLITTRASTQSTGFSVLSAEPMARHCQSQLVRLREHVEQLPGSRSRIRRPAEARMALSLLTSVQLAEARDVMAEDSEGRRSKLENLLDRLTSELWSLSDMLTLAYFSQAVPSRQFADS